MVDKREIGHALIARGSMTDEDNWELRFPQSAKVFSKMGREDSQVTSILKAVSLPIQRAAWQIDPNGAPAEIVAHVAEDLRLQVRGEDGSRPVAPRRGRVSWSEHLQQALLALQFGSMFFEQVYAPGVDGREHLVKLAPRPAGTIEKIEVARDGGLVSVRQQVEPGGRGKPPVIPVSRLVAYVHDPKDSTWTGTSVLRPAFKHWKLRDEFLRLEATVLDRNGMGVPVYEGSELSNDPKSDLEYGQKIAAALRSGTSSGAAVPAKAKLTLQGVQGQLTSPREAIAYHDAMMAKAVLAHFLNLEGKGGSYALAETQSDLFIQSLQTIAEWIADTATQHIVEDLVDVAFPDHDGLCPRVVFDPIASKKELSAADLATLVRDKVILPDKDLEEDTRRRYSLPAKRPMSEAKREDPDVGKKSPGDLKTLVDTAGVLIDRGYAEETALEAVGLNPISPDAPDPSAPSVRQVAAAKLMVKRAGEGRSTVSVPDRVRVIAEGGP